MQFPENLNDLNPLQRSQLKGLVVIGEEARERDSVAMKAIDRRRDDIVQSIFHIGDDASVLKISEMWQGKYQFIYRIVWKGQHIRNLSALSLPQALMQVTSIILHGGTENIDYRGVDSFSLMVYGIPHMLGNTNLPAEFDEERNAREEKKVTNLINPV